MTELVGSRSVINIEETDFRSAVSEPLIKKIGSNINSLIDSSSETYQIGTMFWAYLDESEVQSALDATWVLCDGRNISGSDLSTLTGFTTLPDTRQRFIRGVDNGGGVDPDAPRAINSLQTSDIQSHLHNMISNDPSLDVAGVPSPSIPFIGTRWSNGQTIRSINTGSRFGLTSLSTSSDSESYPHNITFGLYIKIDN